MYESALMLILSGQGVMTRNVWQQTPLHHCTSQGHLDLMLLLLDSGACVNARDFENLTPLHQAVIHSNKHAAELLLCYGASVHNHHSVTDTISVQQLASHMHVCHSVIANAAGMYVCAALPDLQSYNPFPLGHVWSLQHMCRLTIRRSLGAAKRKRLKELPLPKHLLSYLCSLPVSESQTLHQNWERVRSSKCEAVRKKGAARRFQGKLKTTEQRKI